MNVSSTSCCRSSRLEVISSVEVTYLIGWAEISQELLDRLVAIRIFTDLVASLIRVVARGLRTLSRSSRQ
jgi:hypothetical protein